MPCCNFEGTNRGYHLVHSVQFSASNFEYLDINCVDKGGSRVECIQPEGSNIFFPVEITIKEV